jgi:hypothetical protein
MEGLGTNLGWGTDFPEETTAPFPTLLPIYHSLIIVTFDVT